MMSQANPSRTAWLIATFFGIGHVPVASGTVATLATVPLYLGGWYAGGHVVVLLLAVFVTGVGIAAAGSMERRLGYHDPSEVVVDEVAGFLVTMLYVAPTPLTVTAGFFLFRGLDILKPWPASAAEKLRGGWGIMADDLVCGGIANILIHLGLYLWR